MQKKRQKEKQASLPDFATAKYPPRLVSAGKNL